MNKPVNMAEVNVSFPYKEQIEKFRVALGKANEQEVQDEYSKLEEGDVSADERPGQHFQKQKLKSFRFLGVVVQRRRVDLNKKPMDPTRGEDGWLPFDPAADLGPLLMLGYRETQPEDPKLGTLMFPYLVIPPPLADRDVYPTANEITGKLHTIAKTLDQIDKEMATTKGATVAPTQPFSANLLDIYQLRPTADAHRAAYSAGPGESPARWSETRGVDAEQFRARPPIRSTSSSPSIA